MYIFFDSARRLMRCRIQASGRPQSRWLRSSKIWDPKKRAGQEKGEASNRNLKIVFVGFDPEEFLDLNHPFPIPSATMVQDLIPHLPIWDSPQLQRTLCPGDGFPSCRDFRGFFVSAKFCPKDKLPQFRPYWSPPAPICSGTEISPRPRRVVCRDVFHTGSGFESTCPSANIPGLFDWKVSRQRQPSDVKIFLCLTFFFNFLWPQIRNTQDSKSIAPKGADSPGCVFIPPSPCQAASFASWWRLSCCDWKVCKCWNWASWTQKYGSVMFFVRK